MCNLSNLTGIRNAIALELFGSVDRSESSMKTLSLAASLSKKYFSIPPEKLFYYPNILLIFKMIEED